MKKKNGKISPLVLAAVLPSLVLAVFMFFTMSDSGVSPRPLEHMEIAVATDLHYLSPSLTDRGEFYMQMVENGDAKLMQYSAEIVDALFEQVTEDVPELLIISGDLSFNGERQSHLDLADKLSRVEAAGTTVLVLPGNHDMYNSLALRYEGEGYSQVDTVDAEGFARIYGDFGYAEAVSRDENSLSYMARCGSLLVLMLDVNTPKLPGTVTEDTLAWVERQLESASAEGLPVLAVSHQNLLSHNPAFSFGYVMGRNEQLLQLYERYGVICNLSGHMHLQHISVSESGLADIAGESLLMSPLCYGRLTLEGFSGQYVCRELSVPLPEELAADWDSFTDFARAYTYQRDYARFVGDGEDEQRLALADAYARLNAAYFSGSMDTLELSEAELEGLKSLGKGVINSMLEELGRSSGRYDFALLR